MMEKIFGCSLITMLCSILLIEADFNATNKIVYRVRMLAKVRKYKLMPEEMFSKRNQRTDNGTLSKILKVECYLINYPYLSDYGQTIFCLSFPSRDRATAPGQCE
jgi:hypothetical protein